MSTHALNISVLTLAAVFLFTAGSTIAGNLTILGAASNVIIIQSAESWKGGTIIFLEFGRAGSRSPY